MRGDTWEIQVEDEYAPDAKSRMPCHLMGCSRNLKRKVHTATDNSLTPMSGGTRCDSTGLVALALALSMKEMADALWS